MASIVKRISDVVTANLKDLGVEDPERMIKQTADAVGKLYQESGVKTTVEEAASLIKEQLDKTGASDVARSVSDAAGEALDTVSGKNILELLEERTALQDRYNDVLATKLEEALRRIVALEDTIRKRT